MSAEHRPLSLGDQIGVDKIGYHQEKWEQIRKSDTSLGVYLGLLSREEYPQTPDNLPGQFVLPYDISAHLDTLRRESCKTKNELGQLIGWDGQKNDFALGEINKGTENQVRIKSLSKRFPKRPLIEFHTHPGVYHSFFSMQDLYIRTIVPSPAYLALVGNQGGGFALLTTEAFKQQSRKEAKDWIRQLDEKGFSTQYPQEQAPILEKAGLGVYSWDVDVDAQAKGAGIALKRVIYT